MMMATAMREPPNKRIDNMHFIILSKYIFYTPLKATKQQCVVIFCTQENMNHNKKVIK